MSSIIHIIRHGEGLHNVQRGYPLRDPPLTEAGAHATTGIELASTPDLILISPMTRTIQTAINAFPFLYEKDTSKGPAVQIWPDLREANDAICNKGFSRTELQSKFPQFDFLECHEEWDYPAHTIEGATTRAERVRRRLKDLPLTYKNIFVITHRGFVAFLVKGRRFNLCETRLYRFASPEETQDDKTRMGLHCDTLQEQDFGPTLLVLHSGLGQVE